MGRRREALRQIERHAPDEAVEAAGERMPAVAAALREPGRETSWGGAPSNRVTRGA
jgi:hypothetical protein